MKDTTVKIDSVRRETLKDAAFEISMEIREVKTMTDVMRFLIDNYTEKAKEDMVKSTKSVLE